MKNKSKINLKKFGFIKVFFIFAKQIETMTIKETLKQKFTSISDSVTIQDKIDAETLFSRPTIDKYLSGDIVKIATAEKLLDFFSKRIQKRMIKIRKTNLV